MIQITVIATSFMTTEQKRDESAPRSVMIRRASWMPRPALTLFLVFGLMGVHVDLLKLPHCKAVSQRFSFVFGCPYRVRMPIEVQQWSLLLRSRRHLDPACLGHCLRAKARVSWAIEVVGVRTIIKEWRRRSTHDSDWSLRGGHARTKECRDDGRNAISQMIEVEFLERRINTDSRPSNAIRSRVTSSQPLDLIRVSP